MMRMRWWFLVLLLFAAAFAWLVLDVEAPVEAPALLRELPQATEVTPDAPPPSPDEAAPAPELAAATAEAPLPTPAVDSVQPEDAEYVLRVHVVDSRTRQPVRDFEVTWTRESTKDLPHLVMAQQQGYGVAPVPAWSGMAADAQWTAVNDPEGLFELRLPERPEYLAVAARSEQHTPDAVILKPETIARGTVEVALKPCGRIEGVVLYDGRGPAVGVTVAAQPQQPDMPTSIRRETQTDGRGRFRFDGMYGNVILTATGDDSYTTAREAVSVSTGETGRAELVLSPGAIIEGQVTLDGRPLQRATVVVTADGDVEALTDDDGRYSMAVAADDSLRVACRHGNTRMEKTVRAESGMVTQVDFAFTSAGGSITGAVTFDGAPVPKDRLRVEAAFMSGDASGEPEVTTWDGGYEVTGLQPGRVEVSFLCQLRGADAEWIKAGAMLSVAAGQAIRKDFHLTSARGSVSGVVAGVAEGNEAVVVLYPEGWTQADHEAIIRYMHHPIRKGRENAQGLSQEGAFLLENIPAGRYTLFGIAFTGGQPRDMRDAAEHMRMVEMPVEIYPDRETVVELALPPAPEHE